ncbi:MAG: hypothetical protein KJO07_18950 [Deltaproteobacteria bacterium]|nr:hypothetical protein [Deltaproteobacteria bacterium]
MKLLAAPLLLLLVACTTAMPGTETDVSCEQGLCDEDVTPEPGSSVPSIIPVVMDDAALSGRAFPESRSAYADLQRSLTDQGAATVAYFLRFGATAEDHPSTIELAAALGEFPGTLAMQEHPSGSPSIYADNTLGHGALTQTVFRYRSGSKSGQEAFVIYTSALANKPEGRSFGDGPLPLSVAGMEAYLLSQGASPQEARETAMDAARCNGMESGDGGDLLLPAVDPQRGGELEPILAEVEVELLPTDIEPVLASAPVLASQIISGETAVPAGALVYVGTEIPDGTFADHEAEVDLTVSTFAEIGAWSAATAFNACE